MTVAVAPLAGAQVKAGAGARVAVVALLQSARRKKNRKKKNTSGEEQVTTKREYVFVPLQHGNRHTAIIIKDCSGGGKKKKVPACASITNKLRHIPAGLTFKKPKIKFSPREMESSP